MKFEPVIVEGLTSGQSVDCARTKLPNGYLYLFFDIIPVRIRDGEFEYQHQLVSTQYVPSKP